MTPRFSQRLACKGRIELPLEVQPGDTSLLHAVSTPAHPRPSGIAGQRALNWVNVSTLPVTGITPLLGSSELTER